MTNVRINKSVFRYIEFELYNYDNTKKELARYKEETLHSTPRPDVSAQAGLGDTTANKAIKMTSSAFVVQAERIINAIEKSLAILGDKHKQLFKLKYQDILPWQEITIEMNISDRSYFRLRREIVATVGQQLGVIDIE